MGRTKQLFGSGSTAYQEHGTESYIVMVLTSLIPGVHLVTFALMNIAWVQYKVIKQRTFNVRPGLLYSLATVALFVNFIFIIPAIVFFVGRKRLWGSGIRGLMKKGRIGTGD